ncbi:MAG TPA: arylsulfotransferase family protein [Sandaracinaceae bacterium LLY-WYZ-13_1]|nr:arylsulfotransferase family protein [Sandaracinaceae bacterium LLY-WYZ-13_1]
MDRPFRPCHPLALAWLLGAAAMACSEPEVGEPAPEEAAEPRAERSTAGSGDDTGGDDTGTGDAPPENARDDADGAEPAAAAAVPEETTRALEALGYLPTAPTDNPEDRGVTVHEPSAWEGLNLYSSRHRASAILMGMDGREVHRWEAEDAEGSDRSWMHVEPLPTGEILAITKDRDLAKHAWDSSLVWRRRIPAHHDLAIADDGRLYVLIRARRTFRHRGDELPVIGDGVAVLSADGRPQRTVWLLPLLRDEVSRTRLARLRARLEESPASEVVRPGGVADLLHTNSIAILHRDIEGVAPAGSFLLSLRSASRIVILDADLDEVLWTWGAGELQAQHDATQLPNGHLMIFDNGTRREQSRVLELDAAREEIVWTYTDPALFTRLRGGAQRLPNDHVLVTEADSGHAFEVTRDGTLVWELWNPDVRPRRRGESERAILYRLNRFPRSFFAPL